MKTIILCEGENDSDFLEKMLKKLNYLRIKVFNSGTSDTPQQVRCADTREFRSLISSEILIKSEAGKDKVIDVFSSDFAFLLQQKTILMLDLDTPISEKNKLGRDRLTDTKLKNIKTKLEGKINKNRSGNHVIIEQELSKKTDSIYLFKNNIKGKRKKEQIGNFYLVLFVHSLENEAHIHRLNDKISIEDKISKFVEKIVEKKDVKEIFYSALN